MISARVIRQFHDGAGAVVLLAKDLELPAVPTLGSRVCIPAEDFEARTVVGVDFTKSSAEPPSHLRVYLEWEPLAAVKAGRAGGWQEET
jgi:hypothetical protein